MSFICWYLSLALLMACVMRSPPPPPAASSPLPTLALRLSLPNPPFSLPLTKQKAPLPAFAAALVRQVDHIRVADVAFVSTKAVHSPLRRQTPGLFFLSFLFIFWHPFFWLLHFHLESCIVSHPDLAHGPRHSCMARAPPCPLFFSLSPLLKKAKLSVPVPTYPRCMLRSAFLLSSVIIYYLSICFHLGGLGLSVST